VARGKKKRTRGKKRSEEPEDAGLPSAPERISRLFADALRGVRVDAQRQQKPAPRGVTKRETKKRNEAPRPAPAAAEPERPEHEYAKYSYEDRVALSQIYADVRPLGRRDRVASRRPVEPPREKRTAGGETEGDAHARARLAALVAGGVRFDVQRDEDGGVRGQRAGVDPGALRSLRNGRARPDAEVDLHGLTGAEAEHEVVRFIRQRRQRGARVVRIVHGKGLHSEGGLGVLGDRVLRTLTDGGAAPFVLAFTSAAPDGGGRGALLVRLTK